MYSYYFSALPRICSGCGSAKWSTRSARLRATRASPFSPSRRASGKFVWEVLLQGQVIQQRPLPGLAHAFVFWGFCAFALVTLNHFAAGPWVAFCFRATAFFGAFYFGLAAVFAVAVAVSIAGSGLPPVRGPPELAG